MSDSSAPLDVEPRSSRAMTRFADLGGRRVAHFCSGAGTPTVVLETGLGAESQEWAVVQRGVEQFTRVCRYDRAGRGDSDPAARPRSARAMIFDLHELLQRAAIPGPYVLVGHSFGGLLVRLFAHWYRGDTAGLVLVDSMHEDQFAVFGPRFPAPTAHDSPALSQLRAFWTVGWREPNSTTEGIDFPESIAQAQEIAAFGQLPIEVLTAGTFLNQALVPERAREPLQHLWNDLQQRFLTLSSNSVSTFVPDSGHFMQRDRPDKVIEAIHRVVAGVRQAEALPGD